MLLPLDDVLGTGVNVANFDKRKLKVLCVISAFDFQQGSEFFVATMTSFRVVRLAFPPLIDPQRVRES
jgi:hypothetical protein